MLRRSFVKGLMATFVAAAAPVVMAQPASARLDAREEIIVRDLSLRGVDKLLLLNKKIGQLRAVENGKILFSVPAITSAQRGDTFKDSPGVTPAGIFPLRIPEGQMEPDAAMCFAELAPDGSLTTCTRGSRNLAYAIHHPASQRRADILARPARHNADTDMRLSAGCINLGEKDYRRIAQFAESAAQDLTTRDGTPVRRDSFLVTLPESASVEETRRFFGIPAPS